MMRGRLKVDQRKLKSRRRKRAFFVSLYSVFAIGIAVSGLSFLSFLGFFAVRDIKAEGLINESSLKIESVVREKLSGAYLSLFSRGNILIYPESEIEGALMALPRIREAEASRDGFAGLRIEVKEREEIARWCDAEDSCYAIDEAGYVFAKSGKDVFVYRGTLSGDPIGQELLPEDTFKKIEFFLREVRSLELEPAEAELAENDYLNIRLAGGGTIIIYVGDDLSAVLQNLESVITDPSVAPSLESFLATLDYLKLDTGNKVTYKKK